MTEVKKTLDNENIAQVKQQVSDEAKVQHLIGKFTEERELQLGNDSNYADNYLKEIIGFSKLGGLSFASALFLLKQGCRVSRKEWGRKGTDITMKIQNPDKSSKMTKPYLYMEKRFLGEVDIFPFTIDSENILANDWFLVEE